MLNKVFLQPIIAPLNNIPADQSQAGPTADGFKSW